MDSSDSNSPIVDINVVLKLFSLNLNRMHVLPTPIAATKREKQNKKVPDIKDFL